MEIQFPQIIFQIINFGVVLGALHFLLNKPIQKIFEERANRVKEGQEAASESIKEKEQLNSLKKKVRQDAEKEAAVLMTEARNKAKDQKSMVLAEAKAQAKTEIAKMKAQLENDRKRMISDMRAEMLEAVSVVSKKVAGVKLSSKEDAKLIEKELDSVLKEI